MMGFRAQHGQSEKKGGRKKKKERKQDKLGFQRKRRIWRAFDSFDLYLNIS